MHLIDLIPDIDKALAATSVTGVTADSREVSPGNIFVAIRGMSHDGHDHIDAAIKAGAAAIIVEGDAARQTVKTDIPVISMDNTRQALALIAARCHDRQPTSVIAVTGTNGKTSTVEFIRQICQRQAGAVPVSARWGSEVICRAT